MSSIRQHGRRIPLRPDRERDILRERLLALYRAEPKYQTAVVQDLRWLWLQVRTVYALDPCMEKPDPSIPYFRRFCELQADVEERALLEAEEGIRRDPALPRLREYVRKLRDRVQKTMGLALSGEPVGWALEAVHADVMGPSPVGVPLDLTPAYFVRVDDASLRLRVTDMYARVSVVAPDDTLVAEQEIQATFDLSFDEWDEFRQVAHKLLDEQIDRMAGAFEERHKQLRKQAGKRHTGYTNSSTLIKYDARLRTLFALYCRRCKKPLRGSRAEREALRELIRILELDTPQYPPDDAEE